MSVILNENKVYLGWELPKSEMATEEKALLISLKQNFIFLFVKIGASIGFLFAAYYFFDRYYNSTTQINLSEMVTLIALYVFAGGAVGYLTGVTAAKMLRK